MPRRTNREPRPHGAGEGRAVTKERADGTVRLETACGPVIGLDRARCDAFLGVPYAHAERFRYAAPTERWDGVLDARRFGFACPQNRAWHEHTENPTFLFYKREYREGSEFRYDEDCLNLNIYTPKNAADAPVIVFIHGGGFDSGINAESPFDGESLAARGVVTVFINYRLGVLGWLTHEEIRRQEGRDGNFGLDDQLTAIRWVRTHIADFGGDPDNITLLGQSAGAISIQYLCLNPANTGLFRRAAMMSGAGLFPRFALPRRAEDTHAYWEQFIQTAGCRDLDELRRASLDRLFDAVEAMKALRKDGIYHTMPVQDGLLIPGPIDRLIRHPLPLDYLIGYTNNDLYAPVMAWIGNRFGRRTHAWLYYFDLDAPGDDNRAFHSSDLRYLFETLDRSWRPYGARDREASGEMAQYLANFARSGDPNGPGLALWRPAERGLRTPVLHIAPSGTRMGRVSYGKLTRNLLTKGDPKDEI